MKPTTILQKIKRFVSSPQFILLGILGTQTSNAMARNVSTIPEPSLLSLVGAGVVVAIIAYRIKGGK